MSAEDNFIARWSRLKQQAADEKRKPRADAEPEGRRSLDADGEVAEATSGPGGASVGPAETEPAFDPASLPSIESIVAGSDIRAFLQKGVPAALTKAALRRAWTTDPAIRDFIEVAENQWDFTDPTAIPGFGPLQASDDLRQLVGQALGNLPEAPASSHASGGSQESTDGVASAQAEVDTGPGEAPTEVSATHMQVASSLGHADNLDADGAAASQHARPASEAGNAPRRKAHGRAMPRQAS